MLSVTSTRGRLFFGLGALLLVIAGCQAVAGIGDRKVDPLTAGCTLPSGSGPQVRIANLAPTGDLVDVCIRPAGASSWGRPVLLNGGRDDTASGAQSCTTQLGAMGYAYGQVSVAFTAPAASVDVKMVAGGSTCSAAALGEGDGLTLATNAVTTLALLGGAGGVNETVAALPEADSTDQQDLRVRFVNAAPGSGSLDLGLAASHQLPTTISTPILSQPVAFGTAPPGGEPSPVSAGTIQDNGYFAVLAAPFYLASAVDGGSGKAILIAFFNSAAATTYSLYAIGVAGDSAHPLRGLACNEDVGAPGGTALTLPCSGTSLPTISVDVFNAALYGPNAPFNEARKSLVATAVGQRDPDVMCMVEVDDLTSRNNMVAAAKQSGTMPYSYLVNTTLSTPITNPAAQNGQVPPAPTSPPCNTSSETDLVNQALSCAEQYCSNAGPGDPSGSLLSSTDCLATNCAGQLINIQGASAACYDCVIDYIVSDDSWGTTLNNCTTDTRPPLGFDGQDQNVILSKYPLSNTDVLILPSTLYRRSVLYAQVQLEDQTFDFYCGFLISTLIASDLPYDGVYGNGATDSQTGWDNEQLYQAQQVISWIQQKSGNKPAIVVGDWRSSVGIPADAGAPPAGTYLPLDLNPQTMQLFQAAPGFTFAVASGPDTKWQPQCNFCPIQENPYNGDGESYFMLQPMLVNWPNAANATKDESIPSAYTQGVLNIGSDAGVLGPISPYYGLNIRVLRPQ